MTRVEKFGETPAGEAVERITLVDGGLTARFLTYGATLQDLRLEGYAHPLTLGAPDLEPYFGPRRHFGALVGRFANRIGGGRFELDGREYALSRNWLGRHTLHGGEIGAGQRLWRIDDLTRASASLSLTLADGEMGFPGKLQVRARISVEPGALAFDITAETDQATPCAFAHHGYFNLDGGPDIVDHLLMVEADSYLPVDADLIPTGEIRPLADSPFDFRQPAPVGGRGLDHNFCLARERGALRPAACLIGPKSGLRLTVETTEPGLQIYDGAGISPDIPGLEGRRYGPAAGIALETQCWPDAPNRPEFPDSILRPGQSWRALTRYAFSKDAA